MRTVGVRGGSWRALVDDRGTLHPTDGSSPLAWHVAGEERWFSPVSEPTVRQTWLSGCPVVETRMRVGTADVVQRIWAVADDGGITVVEFENEGPVAVAVAVTRGDVMTARAVTPGEPRGIELPSGSVVLPLAHRSTLRVGLRHRGAGGGLLPEGLADHRQVVHGWETACAVASRVVLPEPALTDAFVAARCSVLLGDGAVDPVESVRLGETHRDSVVELVDHVQRRLNEEKRVRTLRFDTPHLLAASARAAMLLGDDTVAGDIGAAWLRLADRPVSPPPAGPPADAVVAWVESRLLSPSPSGGHATVLPGGAPTAWVGASFEGHGLVADPVRTLSYAVRWHGHRPALLWEVSGAPGLVIDAGGLGNETWHTAEPSGETLLATVHDH